MVGRSRLQLAVGPGERPALAHRARAHLEQASRAAADFSGAGHERYACRVRADSAQTWCARPRLLQASQKSAWSKDGALRSRSPITIRLTLV